LGKEVIPEIKAVAERIADCRIKNNPWEVPFLSFELELINKQAAVPPSSCTVACYEIVYL
jgi:hypothetical protein